jgi:hypothetical protein
MNDPTVTDSGIDFVNPPREELGDWYRHADLMREQANGRLLLDLSRFDDLVPVPSAPVASHLQR